MKRLIAVVAITMMLSIAPAPAAFNGFANFGDIKGESTDADHKDQVMICSIYGQIVIYVLSVAAAPLR